MSSVAIQGNASGAGVFTIASPNSASSYTATLPTATGTLLSSAGALVTSATGVVGYDTGAGGAVTQATSKTTTVTLNTPSGRITMNGAALAANAVAEFQLNNSLLTNNAVIALTISGNVATATAYVIGTRSQATGAIVIGIRNITGGSLSETVQISFVVLGGATS